MPVTDVQQDLDSRTLTITAHFAAPVERIWALYADPRQLERVWGPPTYPATFVDHDLVPGSRVTYYMTSPENEKFAGYWVITEVQPPHVLAFDDGFAHADLSPNDDLPVSHNRYTFTADGDGTRAVYETRYETAEDLQQVLAMGVIEGASAALAQIDQVLAA